MADGTVGGARSWWRLVRLSIGALVVLGCLYVAITFAQVWHTSRAEASGPADAIVVLGAAQYDGRPSPVLQARLDAALGLYRNGIAPLIVTTGSNQAGDRFTQGFAGFTYLRDAGVPEADLRVVVDGTTTYEELAATANVLLGEDIGTDVVVVSDPYHGLRAVETAREVGLDAVFSPTDLEASFSQLARETVGVSVGRLAGYRRISGLS